MKRAIDRTLIVAIFFVGVVWMWTIAARTDWAATRSLIGAGPEYTNALWPFLQVFASTVLAVIAVDAIQIAWKWFALNVLGREPKRRRIPQAQ